ncbi:MAG: hypothetical protein WAV46_01720 [Candidatus Moraniibacteriota bacterium]
MRYYSSKETISLDDEIIKKAKEFADKVVGTINYGDSNQFDLIKIANDHFISKIGEEAAKKVFESLGKNVQGPNYTIYEKKEKSWDADLLIDSSVEVAVKTQKKSAADRFGLSWTFQASPERRDIILDNKDAWVVFVECNDKDGSFDCTVYPPYQIKELTFGEPKLDYLKGKKKVVYATNLPII